MADPHAPPDVESLRARLEATLAEALALEREAAQNDAAVELDQARVGRLSRMDALQGQAMSRATSERRRALIRAARAALARIEDGGYGDCVDCGEPIDPRRLALDPAAARCVRCAEAAEEGDG